MGPPLRLSRGLLAIALLAVAGIARAQPAEEGFVELNFPNEVELRGLVDYVSERAGVKILYDEKIANKKISIRASTPIPVDSLVSVLQSALKVKGLLLIDADTPGWKKIVEGTRLPEIARTEDPAASIRRFGTALPVTQPFVLSHADPTQVELTLKPFLTTPGANTIALKDQGVVIITDYADNVLRLGKLIELIDKPRISILTKFLKVEHSDADALATQITGMLTSRAKVEGGPAGKALAAEVFADTRTNQLIMIGDPQLVAEIERHVQVLDVPLGMETRVYEMNHVAPDRIDRLIKELMDAKGGNRVYRSAIDAQDNLLIVSAAAEVHARIKSIKDRMDIPAKKKARSPVKFYKLKYATVTDVIDTIRAIEGGESGAGGRARGTRSDGRFRFEGAGGVTGARGLPGPNRPQLQPMQVAPRPPALRDTGRPPDAGLSIDLPPVGQDDQSPPADATAKLTAGLSGGAAAGRVTADVNANTLIVVGPPEVQAIYAELIQTLDRQRPQVMIESKIVILDTTQNFTLGVEVSAAGTNGIKQLFAFSSFGFSTANPVNGALSLIPGAGFNGAFVDPGTADIIIRALSTNTHSRVISAPRVVVNDNASGILTSVTEVPFTSVNASQTVATTSFAGFAQAGTTITVTPHISEGDHLQLDYRITRNDFTTPPTSGAAVPPPRTTDELQSTVTIPDGHTVIVGGLSRTSDQLSKSGIPFLQNIPLLEFAASTRSRNFERAALFIFLRPVILRDDKFRDLKYYSDRDRGEACLPPDFPESRPVLMR